MEELGRRVVALERAEPKSEDTEAGQAGDVQDDDLERDWPPPRRRPGMTDAGVVTLEEQPDEEHAFGPAAQLVAEWRELQVRE